MLSELLIPPYDRYAIRLKGGEHREYVAQPTPKAASYLYCMTTFAVELPYIKIGRSKAPLQRLQQVSTGRGAAMPPGWQGEAVDLACIRPGGHAEEQRIHGDLDEYRIRGTEWFLGHTTVVDYLSSEGPEWQIWWAMDGAREA